MLICVRIILLLMGLCFVPFAMSTTLMAVTEFELEFSDGEFVTVRSAGNSQSQWLEVVGGLEVVRGLEIPPGQALVKRSGTWYLAEVNSQQQALSTGVPLVGGDTVPGEAFVIQSFSLANAQVYSSGASAVDEVVNSIAAQSFALSSSLESVQQDILLLRVSFLNQDFSHSVESFQQLMFAEEGSQVLSVA